MTQSEEEDVDYFLLNDQFAIMSRGLKFYLKILIALMLIIFLLPNIIVFIFLIRRK